MPRSTLKDPDRAASAVIFGEKAQAATLSKVAKETGISVSTLSDYKRKPSRITLERFARIAKVRGLTDEEIGKAVKAFMGR